MRVACGALVVLPAVAEGNDPTQPDPLRLGPGDVVVTAGRVPARPPQTLGDAPGKPVDGETVLASDNAFATTTAPTTATAYQRFDIKVPANPGVETVSVQWEGRVTRDQDAVLSVWDRHVKSWRPVASKPLTGNTVTTIAGEVELNRTLADDHHLHALVWTREPVAAHGEAPDGRFEDPDSYDFSIAWMSDSQYLSEDHAAGKTRFGHAYRSMTGWIAKNAERRKIVYAAHTGDIINNWNNNDDSSSYESAARKEFRFARRTMDVLADSGVPFGVTPGNHDERRGGSSELYNQYFPPSYFDAAEESAGTGEDRKGYFGGPWRAGDNENHYDLIEAGGERLILVYVGFNAHGDEIQWANDVLARYPDRRAVVLTHSYLKPSDAANGRGGARTGEHGDGRALFQRVVRPNDNVFLVLSGHEHGVALNIRRDVGRRGRDVLEMMANYQAFEVDGERRTGFLRLLQFDTDHSTVAVDTYSPALNDHNAGEFDTRPGRHYSPRADEFTVPVDLAPDTRSLVTDTIALRGVSRTHVHAAR